jgi:hypothetical protein
MRKRWIIVSVVMAALAIAITGGAIMAQDEDEDGSKTFAGRVAEILGLEEDTVADAMKQAKEDMRDEAVKAKLDALVEAGKMTQEDADAYLEWLQSKPDVDFGGGHGRGFRGKGGFGRKHGWGWGKSKASVDTSGA